eukprot:TRINITY_DN3644_c0_g1_i1.p1 TRINITY_DN3644_c0_g1~~TRINITY_DN3644_c0_g1_i1.p1  ORF type:complete len:255 (-),score=26.19 TRINITY_DN3644_c0_g1_i1:380-1144(-)
MYFSSYLPKTPTPPKYYRTFQKQQQPTSSIVRAASIPQGAAAKSPQQLNNPIHAWAQGSKSVRVMDRGGETGLSAYMRLPPEQYSILDANIIQYLGNDRFQLNVPRLDLIMNVWVKPIVDVEVTVSPDMVRVRAYNCIVDGPPVIKSLNEKFCFSLWLNLSHMPAQNASRNGNQRSQYGEIRGKARLDVWSENIPQLMLIPKEVIQSTVNLVLDQCMQAFLTLFMQRLANDSNQWQKSPKYRKQREETAFTAVS